MMLRTCTFVVAVVLSTSRAIAAINTAVEALHYLPGTGAAVGYDQPSSILGEPFRVNPGSFGGPVDPFNPPWQTVQLLSIGAGGQVTVRFDQPIYNDPGHAYGLDFLVFGSSGFTIVNGDFSGGGITDGSLFSASGGSSLVSVSVDGIQFYRLDPARAPVLDTLFPTDGAGDFTLPVNPQLKEADFDNLGLSGIRSLYAGSAGGAGFDLGWAIDADGRPVAVDAVRYLRFEAGGESVELDAVVAVPEPASRVLLGIGGMFLLLTRRATHGRSAARA